MNECINQVVENTEGYDGLSPMAKFIARATAGMIAQKIAWAVLTWTDDVYATAPWDDFKAITEFERGYDHYVDLMEDLEERSNWMIGARNLSLMLEKYIL
jgi:hypothetical protein